MRHGQRLWPLPVHRGRSVTVCRAAPSRRRPARHTMGAFATVFRWMVLGSATGVLCFICGCLKPELGGWCLRMAVKVLRSKPVVFLCCASAVTLLYSMWHASLDHFVFDSASWRTQTVSCWLSPWRPRVRLFGSGDQPPPAAQTPGTPASMSTSSRQGAPRRVYPPVNLSG